MNALQPAIQETQNTHLNEELEFQFKIMQSAVKQCRYIGFESRLKNLNSLYDLINDNSALICDALNQDFGNRAVEESLISDIAGSLSSIRFLKRNLRGLMKKRRRNTSIWYWPAKNTVLPQPLGVVGVMAPWNYPVHLMIAPVAAALAAGNRVLAKMSEDTPATSLLLQQLVNQSFAEDTLRIVTGGVDVASTFSSLEFDHLLFTGSTTVGRKIAMAAANHLTPLTLELSGKSPAIVSESFNTEEAAKRITWGKIFNAGQSCIAPDYAFVHKDQLIEFIRSCRCAFKEFFPNGIEDERYSSVINKKQFDRISALLVNAEQNGAEIINLCEAGLIENKIPFTLVINPKVDSKIFNEEVFGPVLSVFTYEHLDEVLEQINCSEDPLALYVFSKFSSEADYIAKSTRAAGVSVNDTLLHYLQNDLPFGGRGTSGYGQYHAKEGFETFSHMQPMFEQRGIGKFTNLKLLYPPYGKLANFVGSLIRRLP